MSQSSSFFPLIAIAVLAVSLSSCAQKESFSGLEDTTSSSGSGPKVVQATPQVSPEQETSILANRNVRGNILTERLVFFDYDKSLVRDEFRPMLDAHTELLANNAGVALILQGHADERGSTEYNLALGQRRSDSVREYMLSGGAFTDQIESISYGEERPRALGANEAAWAENRRVEIIYADE